MKKLKTKLTAFVLSALLVMSMSLPAFAESQEKGSILIKGNTAQTLVGKSFAYHQILTATTTTDETKVAYTVNAKYTDVLCTVIGKLKGGSLAQEEEVIPYLEGLQNDAGLLREFADEVYREIEAAQISPEGTIQAIEQNVNAENQLTIQNLDLGYYLVRESATQGGATSLCMLNSVTKNSTVVIKSDYPTVEKKVQEESYDLDENYGEGYNDAADYDIGDAIPFSYYSKIPDFAGYDTYEMTFYDKMDQGLTFLPESVNLIIGTQTLNPDDFAVHTDHVKDEGEAATFSIVLNDVKQLAQKYNLSVGDPIRVDYQAILNELAVIGPTGNRNTVWLTYDSNPYEKEKRRTEKDSVVVFTFALEVDKVNGDDPEERLAKAEFELQDSEGKVIPVSKLEGTGNQYVVDPNGTDSIVSDGKSEIEIKGLDAGEYYLEEIKAPDGYNKLKDKIKVVVTAAYKNRQTWSGADTHEMIENLSATVGKDAVPVQEGIVPLVVQNFSGIHLPETGGVGTAMFTAGGTVLMGAAVVLLVKFKKKEDKFIDR